MWKKYLGLLSVLFLITTQAWGAAITVPYSGTILDEGTGFEGTGYFKVAICTEADTTLWSNDGTSTDCLEPTANVDVEFASGVYSFMLGDTDLSMSALTTDAVNLNDKLKLRTWFSATETGSFEQFTPDVILGTAMRAGIADTLMGYGPEDFLMADTQISEDKIADSAITESKISDGAITAAKLGSGAVTTISGNAGTATELVNNPTPCTSGQYVTDIAANGDLTCASPTIVNNSVDGTKIALGSDTAGDVMYYNGTDWVRLPKGSDGQILTLASGIPSWAAASGGGISYTTKTVTTGVLEPQSMADTDQEDFNITGVFNTGIIDYITVTQVDSATYAGDWLSVLIYTSDTFATYEGGLIGSTMGNYMMSADETTVDTIKGFRSVYGGSTVNAPVPYYDADGSSELHIRVINGDGTDQAQFQVTLKIREIS